MAVKEITKELQHNFGSISTSAAGWTTDLTLTSWNGAAAKYDLRPWSPDGTRVGKGITMTKQEVRALRDLLNTMKLD
jgi:hypothetical protein